MPNQHTQHTIEIFAAGCSACDADVAARAQALGVESVPRVVIDGLLAACSAARGVDEATLRAETA